MRGPSDRQRQARAIRLFAALKRRKSKRQPRSNARYEDGTLKPGYTNKAMPDGKLPSKRPLGEWPPGSGNISPYGGELRPPPRPNPRKRRKGQPIDPWRQFDAKGRGSRPKSGQFVWRRGTTLPFHN